MASASFLGIYSDYFFQALSRSKFILRVKTFFGFLLLSWMNGEAVLFVGVASSLKLEPSPVKRGEPPFGKKGEGNFISFLTRGLKGFLLHFLLILGVKAFGVLLAIDHMIAKAK